MSKDLEDRIKEVRMILENIPAPNPADEALGDAIDCLFGLEENARNILRGVNG